MAAVEFFCENSNPVFENCEISNNISNRYGGGMYFTNESTATLEACVIQGNFTTGIYGGVLTMIDCDVLNNAGAGIDCYGADITNCRVMGNEKGMCTGYGTTTLTESSLDYNEEFGYKCEGSTNIIPSTSIDNCTFIDNDANGIKGSFASLSVNSCIFAYNGASAISLKYCGNANLNECTIVNNVHPDKAPKSGSAIVLTFSSLNLLSSILAFNEGSEPVSCVEGYISAECCDVYGNTAGDWVGCLAASEGINNNFSSDPLFCDAEQGNYHLQETSPCIMSKKACAPVLGALEPGCNPSQFICGDANGDDKINVSDAVYIINYVFSGGAEPDPRESGEVNCDGKVNISDAVYLINYVFSGGNNPCDYYRG